ncbi:MAG: WecB/TagA/CpsF family glycosyltransferase [Sedimentisphaerales bacterium]|nr:WecB/TagA/CpsF family glycosyltransferase [Sedimentisphaerales bacterium]
MTIVYATVLFGTMTIATFLVPIISRLAKRYRLVDPPGPRKVHHAPIPRIGGIAFIVPTLALVSPLFFLNNEIGRSFREQGVEFTVLLAAASLMFVIGLIDDLRSVPGYIKLLCLLVASLAVCASGATLRSFSLGTWLDVQTGLAGWPLTVLWITAITVCMNFVDGLDGLAAGIAAMVCGAIALLAFLTDQAAMVVLMLALLGSVVGFLLFNFHPAKIFMGDGGSMFLGFVIGAGSIVCQTKTSTAVGLVLPFLVLGVPIFDTGFTIFRRQILERRSAFSPDRKHLHHLLLDLGLCQRTVALVIYAVTAINASIGVFLITATNGQAVGLTVAGLLLLLCLFMCVHSRRHYEILATLKHNWIIGREIKAVNHNFEAAELRMRDATTFARWWEIVCEMGGQMYFQSIGLWNRRNGDYVSARAWDAPDGKFPTNRTTQVHLPLRPSPAGECELRVRIWVNGCLEVGGRQALLLARLMDEFPPPVEKGAEEHTEAPVPCESPILSRQEEARNVTVAEAQTMTSEAQMPAPVTLMGVPVVPFETYDQALACIEEKIESNCRSLCVAINPIKMHRAWHEPELLHMLRQTDVSICDGIGVSLASRILHGRSIKRITGCDLFFKLLSLASRRRWGVYLLGASAQANAAARQGLQDMYPQLRIVGWHDGYFEDSAPVVDDINASGADLLFVAMGSPKQEYWLSRHRHLLDARFCMGVGGSFDVASGNIKRAPKVFRMTGTEFLFRFAVEPRKRLSHQGILLRFLLRVVGAKLSGADASLSGAN